ncbi:MAG: glycoside hydrolase family 3 protein [Treponema sp.]|nr:glycoside hydrolase family 3 protein [Treponema sp.]
MTRTMPAVVLLSALFFSFTAFFSSCRKDPAELARLERERDEKARAQAIADYVAQLSDDQKISQLFLVNVEGDKEFVPVEKTGALYGNREEGTALVPGGCLLFSYNIGETPAHIAGYISSIRRFYHENNIVPPYVAIDQEGGYVNRLRKITSNLVSQKKVAEWFSAEQAHDLYAAQAKQLRALGIQMNLAPVVEVETDSNRDFLDTRSFGTLEQVLSYCAAEIAAYEEQGIGTVIKHFPGNNNTDPHIGLPKIDLTSNALQNYLEPFTKLAPSASALLMSHIIARVTEPSGNELESTARPACFSPYWIQEARKSFDGLIFSDDIFMGALANNGYPPEVAVVAAIDAGINCIMLSEKTFGEVAGVLLAKASEDASLAEKITASVCRVIAYKIKAGVLQFEKVENAIQGENAKKPAEILYRVRESETIPAFSQETFQAAYDDGMSFYK